DITVLMHWCNMCIASHSLQSEALNTEENQSTHGKCNNPHGHGHNYALEVTVSGPVEERTGMICNLLDLDTFVDREILERFDHQNLNMLSEFTGEVPTTENLCDSIHATVQ